MTSRSADTAQSANDVFRGRGAELFTFHLPRPTVREEPGAVEPRNTQALSNTNPSPSSAPGTLLQVEAVGPRVRVFQIARPRGLTFAAGQYVKLGLASLRSHKYSIASAPEDERLSFCIALVPGGRLTPGLFSLQPGSRLKISPNAGGKFALDPGARTHFMVATTTGVAPFRSMIRSALEHGSKDRFVLVHAASYLQDLPYFDDLAQLVESSAQLTYLPTLSRPGEARNWSGRVGRAEEIAPALLQQELRRDPSTRVYACGRSEMLDALRTRVSVDVRSESFG